MTKTDLDAVGNKTKVTFPDTTFQQWGGYDAFGQPSTFTDERNDITNLTYQWGPMKKLATVTTHRDKDAGGTENQLTQFAYDLLGRAKQTTFPDLSTEVTTYQYGEVLTWKTRKGATKTIGYDARGRENLHTWSDGGVTPSVTQGWDDANRITSLANVFSAIGYSYDSAGQVVTESNNVTGSSGIANLSYARYPDGAPSLVTYPNGFGLRRDYTARGQLDKTGSADASGNYITQFVDYAYLADGKVTSETYGNGVQTSYGYDGRGFVNNTKTSVVSSGAVYSNRTYYRDNRDRITSWVKSSSTSTNPLENGRGDAYTYDQEGQLTAAKYEATTPNTTPGTPQRTESFIFDALGNRKGVNQLAARGSVTFSRKDTGVNEYSSWTPSSISYDNNGSLTAEGWIAATYNALNQPVYITSPSPSIPPGDSVYFGYDPLGRPVKRWYAPTGTGTAADNPATYLYYEGWDLIAGQSPVSSSISRIYAHGNRVDAIVADSNDAGTTWGYHHFDARSHCIMLTDVSGNLLEQYDYDAFGKGYCYDANGNALTASSWGNRFLFTGREWLSDLGVYDLRARLYHPELGRFVQPDPKEFSAGDYNIYRYCHNDPVNRKDPTGLVPVSVTSEETAFALQADVNDLKAMADNGWGGLRRYEYSSSVYRDAQNALQLTVPRTDYDREHVRHEQVFGTVRIETHCHPYDHIDAGTGSDFSIDDIAHGNATGLTQEVVTPYGARERYRPSENEEARKQGIGGVIERVNSSGQWETYKGANPNCAPLPGSNPIGSFPRPDTDSRIPRCGTVAMGR